MAGFPQPTVGLQRQAVTPATGFALQNATPIILTWTAPNDGQVHSVVLCVSLAVAVTEVGGALQYTATAGGQVSTRTVNGGGVAGPGGFAGLAANSALVIDPGTTITFSQSSALTSGTATVFAEILAA